MSVSDEEKLAYAFLHKDEIARLKSEHVLVSMEPDFRGEVYFLEEGGRGKPVFTGYQPTHRVKPDYLTSGRHRYIEKDLVWPGEHVSADIKLITPHVYPHTLYPGMVMDITEGHKVVGHVRVVAVFNDLLDKSKLN